jgi:hypothetical protein
MASPRTSRQSSRVATARIEDGRIRLPQHLASHLGWLQGSEVLDVWLLVAELGRYCILLEQDFERNERLRELRERVYSAEEINANEALIATAETASWSARLLPTVVSPRGPGWRLSVPAEVPPAGLTEEGEVIYLTASRDRLEIWSRKRLEELLQVPISKAFPGL